MFDLDGILSLKIGERVYVVSALSDEINSAHTKHRIAQLLQKAQMQTQLTKAQEDYIGYLKQAEQIAISDTALAWLEQRFQELFGSTR
jgi:hypothetical protein